VSALRLGRLSDGTRDVRIIDDGSVARVHGRGVFSGSLVAVAIPRRIPYVMDRPVCGVAMKHGKKCARNPGHADQHKSEDNLRADAANRRGR
jgi:hypothetical protein